MRRSLVALPAFASLLIGCGGSSGGITRVNPPPSYPNLSGNWSVLASSNVTGAIYVLGGYMTNTDSSVTATLHVSPLGSGCYQADEEIPFTGTITTGGSISLTSTAVANQTISVTGSTLGGSVLNGTYKIADGCAAGDNGAVTGLIEPSFTGTYTGNLQPASGAAIAMNATLTQSGPSADGEYNLAGSAQFSGSPCFTTGTITSSTVFGESVQVTIGTEQGSVVQFTAIAIATPSAITMEGEYQVTAGSCSGAAGIVTLSSVSVASP